MWILGLSAFHRNSAAALLQDGRPVAAAREEHFSKKRLDSTFPTRAARFCLQRAGLQGRDLDRLVFYEKPLRKFERLVASQLRAFPRSSRPFSKAMFLWLGDRLWLKNRLAEEIGVELGKVRFTEHHIAHAASAFFPSGFDEAAVLTVDDGGEWATTTLGHGRGNELEIVDELHHPHSLGLFASAVTQFLGFEPGADEDKLEALATWGEPRFERELAGLIAAHSDGSFTVDQQPFRFAFDPEQLFGAGLEALLGEPRHPGGALRYKDMDTRDADVAASLQKVLEERVLALVRRLHERVETANLCLAGSLARNRALNARLVAEGPFEHLYIPAAPGGAGAALGAALYVHHVEGGERHPDPFGTALGESIDERAVDGARILGSNGAALDALAERLTAGECVAWAHGAVDFSPLSLGNRSVLCDARGQDARDRLMRAVQLSEDYLACRLAVVAERASEYFELPEGARRPLRLAQLSTPARAALSAHAPSAIGRDGRAWPQLVDAEAQPEFHRLLARVGEKTGAPLLLHHTFHLRGSPMVRSEADAVEAFARSSLDALVSGQRLYDRDSVSTRSCHAVRRGARDTTTPKAS